MEPSRLFNYQSTIQEWIQNHQPRPSTSEGIAKEFLKRAIIQGSEEFALKVRKTITKASHLATGSTVLQRILETNKEILLMEESQKNQYVKGKGILLALGKASTFGSSINGEGEKELKKHPSVVSFIHECVHKWHFDTESEATNQRQSLEGFLPDMDNQEEEFTITGNLHVPEATCIDPCCENSANLELGAPFTINHRGVTLPKGELPSLCDMVMAKAMGSLKKELKDPGKTIDREQTDPKYRNQTPLHLAFHLNLLEFDATKQKEWIDIIKVLIKAGFKSEYALRIAILENSEELVKLLLEAGVKPSEKLLLTAMRGQMQMVISKLLTRAGYSTPYTTSDAYCSPEVYKDILSKQIQFDKKFPFIKEFSLEIVKLLLEAGADHKVALKIAIQRNLVEVVKLLIESGAELSEEELQVALEENSLKIVELFIESGVKPSEASLETAALVGDCEIVQLFLAAGAKPSEKTIQTAIDAGCSSQIIELLKANCL